MSSTAYPLLGPPLDTLRYVTATEIKLPFHLSLHCSFPSLGLATPVRMWLEDVVCSRDDATLLSCAHSGIGFSNCPHSQDVGVVCNTEFRSSTSGGGGDGDNEGKKKQLIITIFYWDLPRQKANKLRNCHHYFSGLKLF